MKCTCGNDKFYARQITRHDVIVNENNDFLEDIGIYDSEASYGPYNCTKCSKEYEDIR